MVSLDSVHVWCQTLSVCCRFEKWEVEKARRKEKNLPAIVDYRDENYVSVRLLWTEVRADDSAYVVVMPLYTS